MTFGHMGSYPNPNPCDVPYLYLKSVPLILNHPVYQNSESDIYDPTSGGAVLCSKLVDGRCQVQSPVAIVDLAIRIFLDFL